MQVLQHCWCVLCSDFPTSVWHWRSLLRLHEEPWSSFGYQWQKPLKSKRDSNNWPSSTIAEARRLDDRWCLLRRDGWNSHSTLSRASDASHIAANIGFWWQQWRVSSPWNRQTLMLMVWYPGRVSRGITSKAAAGLSKNYLIFDIERVDNSSSNWRRLSMRATSSQYWCFDVHLHTVIWAVSGLIRKKK